MEKTATDQTQYAGKDTSAYRALGLVGDPFELPEDHEGQTVAVALEIRAAALSALRAVEASAAMPRSGAVWVKRSTERPAYYYLMALRETLALFGSDESLNVLSLYVPFDMMRVGRARAVLSVLADRVGIGFDRTLTGWVRRVLEEPDESLPEFQTLGAEGLRAFADDFAADPARALSERFGECELERHYDPRGERDLRRTELDPEPEEGEDSAEFDDSLKKPEERAAEQDAAEGGPGSDGAQAEAEDVEEPPAEPETDPVVDYVVAYTRSHLSPVVARGIAAYADNGTSALARELKITRAPKKTIKAIVQLLGSRYRKVAMVWDRFDNWSAADDDFKERTIGTLTELRWAVPEAGLMVFVGTPGSAPELEEQFPAAATADWTFERLPEIEDSPETIMPDVVQGWVNAATLEGREPMNVTSGPLAPLLDAAEGEWERFVLMARTALASAASRGLDSLDEAAVHEGLAAG